MSREYPPHEIALIDLGLTHEQIMEDRKEKALSIRDKNGRITLEKVQNFARHHKRME